MKEGHRGASSSSAAAAAEDVAAVVAAGTRSGGVAWPVRLVGGFGNTAEALVAVAAAAADEGEACCTCLSRKCTGQSSRESWYTRTRLLAAAAVVAALAPAVVAGNGHLHNCHLAVHYNDDGGQDLHGPPFMVRARCLSC